MCGIAGLIARDPRDDVRPLTERLTDALAHRGPDGSGMRWFRGYSVGLGHCRLSIVDVSGGAQPMANEDENVWVILNGELYNHAALRRELEALGHRFRTRADTEVLVHGWEQWGPTLLRRLNGMYAFALYDGRLGAEQGVVWLARDPVGVKPLYVGVAGNTWWFASELAAARRCGLLPGELRPQAFDEFLVYRFVPSPGTFYPTAWKVPPGHLCRVPLDRVPDAPSFEAFRADFAPASLPRTEGEWREAIRQELGQAVQNQLMSDVPLGSLLSGGVDSTVVTRLMRDHLPEPPQAFAIGFQGAVAIDELATARRAAHALGVPLTEVAVPQDNYLQAWAAQAGALGEPIANTGLLLVGLLCETVRRSRKVVLSGQGADEPLGGYPRHAAERLYPLARRLRAVLGALPERTMTSDRLARMRRVAAASDDARRFTEILAAFGPQEAVAMTAHSLDPDALAEPVRRWLRDTPEADSVNRLLLVDARLSLADDLLIVADHMSMASSVELRVPFLDLPLVSLVEHMPSQYKISRLGERKWLYRQAVRDLVPASVSSSLTGWRSRVGRKAGFSTPLDQWMRQWLHAEAEDFLLGSKAVLPGYLRGEAVRDVIRAARDRGKPRTRQLISLYTLETWLRATVGHN